ncbi:hypothetical protein JCM13664_06890 [Methylothermus subterraneus]
MAVNDPTHAPPIPSDTKTKGKTQHAEAPTAAATPAINALFSFHFNILLYPMRHEL